MKEIEILVEVFSSQSEAEQVLSKWSDVGIKKTCDTYFYDPKRPELQPDQSLRLRECLRLRMKDGHYFITYKKDHFTKQDTWIYSDEEETEVQDGMVMENIIRNLGFKKLIKIESEKHTYHHPKYEIVLERVKNLGLFLEVEACFDDEKVDVDQEKKKIQHFIDDLGLSVSDELNMGKPEMMVRRKHALLVRNKFEEKNRE